MWGTRGQAKNSYRINFLYTQIWRMIKYDSKEVWPEEFFCAFSVLFVNCKHQHLLEVNTTILKLISCSNGITFVFEQLFPNMDWTFHNNSLHLLQWNIPSLNYETGYFIKAIDILKKIYTQPCLICWMKHPHLSNILLPPGHISLVRNRWTYNVDEYIYYYFFDILVSVALIQYTEWQKL